MKVSGIVHCAQVLIMGLMFLPTFISCSKNDDQPEPKQLLLKVSSENIVETEEITFEITADGNIITDGVLIIDGAVVSGLKHSFSEAGTYVAIAKKEGYHDSNSITITVGELESIVVRATQVNTAPREFSLGREFRMCVDNHLQNIYTYDRQNGKFMSYNLATNSWTNLAYGGQLEFTDYGGKMMINTLGQLLYIHDKRSVYNTHSYADISKRDTWEPSVNLNSNWISGGSGWAQKDDLAYSFGGRTTSHTASDIIREHSLTSNIWNTKGLMPGILREVNATFADQKVFLFGRDTHSEYLHGYIYNEVGNISTWTIPVDMPPGVNSTAYQFAVYGNEEFLFYFPSETYKTLYVYNLNKKKWESPIQIEGDFLNVGSVNLFAKGQTVYAAGSRNGNFALYKLNFVIPPDL